MADLLETAVAGDVTASTIDSPSGRALLVDSLDDEARYLRHIYAESFYNSQPGFGTTWGDGPIFNASSHVFKAGSLIHLYYFASVGNDNANWGGMYIEPQIQIDGGLWQSLGSCGYDGGVMHNNGANRNSFDKEFVLDLGMTTDFTFAMKLRCRSYNGTAYLNYENNTYLHGETVMAGLNGEQNRTHMIVQEHALLNGGP